MPPRSIKVPKTSKTTLKVSGSKITDKLAAKKAKAPPKAKPTMNDSPNADSSDDECTFDSDIYAIDKPNNSEFLQLLTEIKSSISELKAQKLASKQEKLKAKEERLKAKELSKQERNRTLEEKRKVAEQKRLTAEEERVKQMATMLSVSKEQMAAKLQSSYGSMRTAGLRLG